MKTTNSPPAAAPQDAKKRKSPPQPDEEKNVNKMQDKTQKNDQKGKNNKTQKAELVIQDKTPAQHETPTPVIKMSKNMKTILKQSNESNPIVQLIQSEHHIPPLVEEETKNEPEQIQPSVKKSKNKYAEKNQQDQLKKLQQLSTMAQNNVSKIQLLTPKVVTQRTTDENDIVAKKIVIIPTQNSQKNDSKIEGKKPMFDLSAAKKPITSTPTIVEQTTHNNDKNNKNDKNPANFQQTALQSELEKKMQGAQFRVLNQQLYTSTSNSAVELMTEQPELFEIYHQGFRTQVEKWPVNPLDVIINKIKTFIHPKASKSDPSSPQNNTLRVADFGCGDAQLALTFGTTAELCPFQTKTKSFILQPTNQTPASGKNKKNLPHGQDGVVNTVKVIGKNVNLYSFDLVAPTTPNMSLPLSTAQQTTSSVITACDSRDVPIPNGSVDIAVFCLSLMGTNFKEFLVEAHRVLVPSQHGVTRPSLIIAEVRSRFDEQKKSGDSKGGGDVYKEFIKFVEKIGFSCLNMDKSNKMFVLFEFIKTGKGKHSHEPQHDDFTLQPCIYKRR
jgi:ribosomal RNA-processing protein 8